MERLRGLQHTKASRKPPKQQISPATVTVEPPYLSFRGRRRRLAVLLREDVLDRVRAKSQQKHGNQCRQDVQLRELVTRTPHESDERQKKCNRKAQSSRQPILLGEGRRCLADR